MGRGGGIHGRLADARVPEATLDTERKLLK
jgi:hypothetical protein